MTEKKLQNEILKIIGSNPNFRLFRNNVGNGYMGNNAKFIRHYSNRAQKDVLGEHGGETTLSVQLDNPRRVRFGLCPGSADLIGLQSIEITPDMVGQKIARFVSIEVKSEKGRLKDDQVAWQKMVEDMGGVAITAKSVEDIKEPLF